MAKVKFPNRVNYNGIRYPAHEVFEIDDSDLKEMQEKGCFVVEEPKVSRAGRPAKSAETTKTALDSPSKKKA